MYRSLFLLLLIIACFRVDAQLLPAENDLLCYRLIPFSFPVQPGALGYKIEIAKGNYITDATFEKNINVTKTGNKNKLIAEVPSFGCQYTWRICYYTTNEKKYINSRLLHFGLKITPDVDTNVSRLKITKSGTQYKDGYIFIDGFRAIYDMKGKPVWFLPGTDLESNREATPRDLKITPQHTITFLTGDQPYEITYTGKILWSYQYKMPNDPKVPFHHEFTRLENGHYMGMILEPVTGMLPDNIVTSKVRTDYDSAGYYRNHVYSSLVEYDEHGNLVWHWSGLAYEYNSDMKYRRTADIPNLDHDLHENGFYFDTKNKVVYMSIRNLSRVIKIQYPDGKVLNSYGTEYKPGINNIGNDLFCQQHSCRLSKQGYLYLYNNNSCVDSHIPTLIMMKEPGPGKGMPEKVWEYQCTEESVDGETIDKSAYFASSGNVLELPNGDMFANMGKPYPKVFIVSRDKKLLWSAVPQKYDPVAKKWKRLEELYRSIYISKKDMESLMMNARN